MDTTLPTWVRSHNKGSVVFLHIQPGSSKSAIIGTHGARLKVKLRSVPEKGSANEELIELFSKLLGIPKSRIYLLKGAQSRQKDLLVDLPLEIVVKLIAKLD